MISFLACVLLWSLLTNGYIPYFDVPLKLFTPNDWWELGGDPVDGRGAAGFQAYMLLLTAGLVVWFSRLGSWRLAFDRLVGARGGRARAAGALVGAWFVLMLIFTNTLTVLGLLADHLPYKDMSDGLKKLVVCLVYVVAAAPVIVFFVRLGRGPVPVTDADSPSTQVAPPPPKTPSPSARSAAPGSGRWPIGWAGRSGPGG
ncbi:hypothetical protein ACQEVM_08635 [Streptomyces sp. CA-243310]|uniref:hypothetical protein n=1 Tax=Streptomyces sp. CA-243310 TaxID=3240056 RepID=UPI003D8A9C87